MANTFRYVFDDRLYCGYSQALPSEEGKKVYRIFFPEQAGRFGDFFEVIETGDDTIRYKSKFPKDNDQFYQEVINWFSDYKLLSD
jgi:hypothetical protein